MLVVCALKSGWSLLLVAGTLFSGGCAVHYYDARSGTENLWGFGHLKMKVLPEAGAASTNGDNTAAVLTSVQALGVAVGAGQDYGGVTLGWDSRSRLLIKSEGASFCLLWPSNAASMSWGGPNLFKLRITTNFPAQLNP